jgi:hypothetical protein
MNHRVIRDVRVGRTPTAFCPPAQGCDAGATLGNRREKFTTPTGLRPFARMSQSPRGQNPVGVHGFVGRLTQSSLRRRAAAATLGWGPERRWRSAAPGEILKALGQLEAEIQQGMKELEGMLK